MFLCELCGEVVPPKTKAERVIVEKRSRSYPSRKNANKMKRGRKTVFATDPGGMGFEIVKEVLACPNCAGAERRIEESAQV